MRNSVWHSFMSGCGLPRAAAVGGAVLIAATMTLGGCKRDQPQATPVSAVEGFLQWRIKSGPHTVGVPTPEELQAMQPYISEELRENLAQAADRHHRSVRPSKKNRPFLEGDLFSSLADGATSFNARDAGEMQPLEGEQEQYVVPVRLWSAKQTPAFHWIDRIKVVYEGGRYVVADVEYQDHWSFGSDTSLLEVLKKDGTARAGNQKVAKKVSKVSKVTGDG